MGIAESGPEQRAHDNNGAARKGSNHSFRAVQTYTNQNVNVKRSSAGNNVLFNALMTQLRDEFKTKGRGRRVESSCTLGSTFGLKYSCKWY